MGACYAGPMGSEPVVQENSRLLKIDLIDWN